MKLLTVCFDSALQLIENYRPDVNGGVLLVRSKTALIERERVLLDIRCSGLADRVLARGEYVGNLWPGHLLINLRPEDHETRAFLMSVANGQPATHPARRHARFPVELSVEWRAPGVSTHAFAARTADVSATGFFIPTPAHPITGTELDITISAPGRQPFDVPARVVHTRFLGNGGMGVELDPSSLGARRVRKLVREIDEQGEAAF